jgi:hypothetical protein
MSLQILLSEAEAAPICAQCRVEMVVVFVRPILFADGHSDITYRCKECGVQQTRTAKQVWSFESTATSLPEWAEPRAS